MLSQLGSIDSVDSADGAPCCGRTYRSNRNNLNKRGLSTTGGSLALDSKSLGTYVVKKEAGGPTTTVAMSPSNHRSGFLP